MSGKQVTPVTTADGVANIIVGTQGGIGSEKPTTVVELFRRTVEQYPNHAALKTERGPNQEWVTWTYAEYHTQVQQFAKALIKIGHQPRDAISIIGFNSPEWFIADIGVIFANGIAAGIYTTNETDACVYITTHSDSVAVVVENQKQLEKFLVAMDRMPKVKALIVYDPQWKRPASVTSNLVYSWNEFLALSDEVDQGELEARILGIKPGHCSTLIYTSGTTGDPKAVMISHDNVCWTGKVAGTWLNQLSMAEEHLLSYLPLSHIAAQMVDIHIPYMYAATVYFARPDALKGSLGESLKKVRPTLFLGVPRVWEKIEEKMRSLGAGAGVVKKTLVDFCKSIGLSAYYRRQENLELPWGYWLADNIVFSKVKEALGLDRCRHCATGAAPIHKETLEYFGSLDVDVFELYGMSECTGPETISRKSDNRTGSTGRALPGTELVIMNPDKDGNGEICYRGRNVFMGYLKNPTASRETIDTDGFLHSGDIGRLDKDGFLYITGRIKELIITAGGENIPPVLIEDNVKEALPELVSNCMVVGDKRKFLTMVICLRTDVNPAGEPLDTLAPNVRRYLEAQGSSAKTVGEAQKDTVVKRLIDEGIKKANTRVQSNAQRVGKWIIAPVDFSLMGGELTETMKLKRRVVLQKYENEINQMYAGSAE